MSGRGRYVIISMLALGFLGAGCTRKPPERSLPDPGEPEAVAPEDDEALASARARLSKKTDAASCRAALQQLNVFLSRNPEQKPKPLDKKQLDALQAELGLDADELVEVNSATFTLLDGNYLEQCFLLRDAARALEVDDQPPMQQAEAAFAWIIRQVGTYETGGPPLPPRYVLRRGNGSPLERALAFLALVHQFDLDGCLVAFAPDPDAFPERLLAGVLIGKEIYLFDTRLGLPLPGAEPGTIATLSQLRSQPDLLGKMTVDAKHPYDVKPEHIQNVEIHLASPLSALSTRMRFLEGLLAGSKNNQVDLAVDFLARTNKFKEVVGQSGVTLRSWPQAAQAQSVTRLLRSFLPAEEGGIDRLQLVPLQAFPGFTTAEDQAARPLNRRQIFEFQLVPWQALPEQIRRLPWNVELGRRPREMFLFMFLDLYGEPRDNLLRGQFEAAAGMLTEKRENFNNIARRDKADLDRRLDRWIEAARSVHARSLKMQEAAKTGPPAEAAIREVDEQIKKLWEGGGPLLTQVMNQAAAAPYDIHLKYWLALCQQENAIRLQGRMKRSGGQPSQAELEAARKAWQDASDWWIYLARDHGATAAAVASRALHAEVLEALGDANAARGLLENLDGPLTPLDKTARLYRARQIKQK